MDKLEFIKLLEDTKIPEGSTDTKMYLQPIADSLMEIMPAQLFRFRAINENSLSAFDKNLIFCSRPKDFNDPYDSLLTAQSLESFLSIDSDNQYSIMCIFRQLLIEGYEIPKCVKDIFPQNLLEKLIDSLKVNWKEQSNCDNTFVKLIKRPSRESGIF